MDYALDSAVYSRAILLLINVRTYRFVAYCDTNRTDVSTQENCRDEISPRIVINLLVKVASRVAPIICAYTQIVRQLHRNHIRLIKWGWLISNCLYARRWARRDWRVVPRWFIRHDGSQMFDWYATRVITIP